MAALLNGTLRLANHLVSNFLPSHSKLANGHIHHPATPLEPTSDNGDLSNAPLNRKTLLQAIYSYPPPPLDPSRETAWLDGLRGVAAFLVMTYHYHLEWWMFQLEAPYGVDASQKTEIWRLPFLRLIMCAGHAQVSVFFVLSGFVLSWSPLASIRRGDYERLLSTLSSATFRRWLRLYLPCFVVGFWSVLEFRMGVVFNMKIERPATIWGQMWHFVKSCEKFSNPLAIDRSEFDYLFAYSWTMWTIPHEFAGSLLVFLTVLGVGRIKDYKRRTVAIAIITAYSLFKTLWTYWLFSTGILLADYVRNAGGFRKLSDSTRPPLRLAMVIVMIISLWLAGVPERSKSYKQDGYIFLERYTPEAWKDLEAGGRWWWCWAGIMFIVSASHLETIRRFFEMPIPRYLGRISYMMYITHRLVYNAFGKPLRPAVSKLIMTKHYSERFSAEYYAGGPIACTIRDIVCWIILGPIAIFVAHWCEVTIDGPSVRFAKWVDEKFVKGTAERKEAIVREEEMHSLTALRPDEPRMNGSV